ncbi:transposase, MuDR, MULE transposase domain protein [Tanacetum coccineum]
MSYRLRLPEELNSVHDTFHVSNLKKCLGNANSHVSLNEIMDREIKSLKRSSIPLVKVRWNSKRGPEFTWEREDYMKSKYPQLFVDRANESASIHGLFSGWYCGLAGRNVTLRVSMAWAKGVTTGTLVRYETSCSRLPGIGVIDWICMLACVETNDIFPWGNNDIVVYRSFCLNLLGLKDGGWLSEKHLDAWFELMWNFRPTDADWAIASSYFYGFVMRRDIPGWVCNGVRYPIIWADVEQIRSFLRYMRPLIIIDGVHFKVNYVGTNLLAIGMDGNKQIIPLATGVSQGETGESWTWVLTKLKEQIGEPPNLCIISDRHDAIIQACGIIFDNSFHGFCDRHLMMNCNLKGKKLRGIFWKACKTYTTEDFDKAISEVRGHRHEAVRKLEETRIEKWSRAYCPRSRYNLQLHDFQQCRID